MTPTRDELLKLAKEAGFDIHPRKGAIRHPDDPMGTDLTKLVARFAALLSAHQAPAQGPSESCKTCGGTQVDPGGLPICRACVKEQPVSGAVDERETFEKWAADHGGIVLTVVGRDGTANHRLFPATYFYEDTELAWRAWANKPLSRAQQAPAVPDYERQRAIMDAERNAAADDYFKARPQIDFIGNRRIFESGFQRGFENRAAAPVSEQTTREQSQ